MRAAARECVLGASAAAAAAAGLGPARGGRGRAGPSASARPVPERRGAPQAAGRGAPGGPAHAPIGRRAAGGSRGRGATSPARVVGAGLGFRLGPSPRSRREGRAQADWAGDWRAGKKTGKFFVEQQMFGVKFPLPFRFQRTERREALALPNFQLGARISAPDAAPRSALKTNSTPLTQTWSVVRNAKRLEGDPGGRGLLETRVANSNVEEGQADDVNMTRDHLNRAALCTPAARRSAGPELADGLKRSHDLGCLLSLLKDGSSLYKRTTCLKQILSVR